MAGSVLPVLPASATIPATVPLGYKGPKGAILVELKRTPARTARELARVLGMALNTVRAHLKELEGERVVDYERVHRGVGAPGYAWRLTPAGEALFPRRYEATLLQLLDYVVEREGRAAAVRVLEGQFEALAGRVEAELSGAETPEARMGVLARALSEQGFMAEGSATFCCGTLVAHNCAIRAVAERFPEICAAEARLLERTLGGRVERRAHLLAGGCACEYKIRFKTEHQD